MQMTPTQFKSIARRAIETLPEEFKPYLENCMLLVEEYPQKELLEEMGIPDDEGLYGLYEGTGMAGLDTDSTPGLPPRITLFYGSLLEDFDAEDELVHEIQTTVLHEIGHHFGLDEDRLADLGYA